MQSSGIDIGSWLVLFGLLIVGGVCYFLPTIVAFARKHHNSLAIFVLNLFLGFSGIAWIIALVWACTAVQRKHDVPPRYRY